MNGAPAAIKRWRREGIHCPGALAATLVAARLRGWERVLGGDAGLERMRAPVGDGAGEDAVGEGAGEQQARDARGVVREHHRRGEGLPWRSEHQRRESAAGRGRV